PPSIVTILEGSHQDPDNQPPSLRVDNQPQYSLHVETSSFQFDPPSIRMDNQPQSSLFIHSDPPSIRVDNQPQYSLYVETSSFHLIRLPYVWIISRNLPYLAWIHIWMETCIIYRRLLPLHGHHLQPLWTKETWLNHRTYSLVPFP
ncbi:hypothetical protein Salat_2433400, partial [Sesamum alatum]